jgi:hypothetical protein
MLMFSQLVFVSMGPYGLHEPMGQGPWAAGQGGKACRSRAERALRARRVWRGRSRAEQGGAGRSSAEQG